MWLLLLHVLAAFARLALELATRASVTRQHEVVAVYFDKRHRTVSGWLTLLLMVVVVLLFKLIK